MKKFIAKLLGIVSVFCCAVALFVACGTKKVTYQVQHIYETLSETAETVVIDFTADENSVVEAEVSPKTGYEFDRDNEKNVLSGKASNGLVLKVYYNLMHYNVGQTQTENGSFTTTVSGETKISAKIGQEVLIKPSADPGYEVYGVSVTDAAGNSVTITDNKFVMPASDVNVSVVFKPIDTVAYEVKHYIKDLTGDGYTPVTQVYFVKPETTVTAEALADAGYVEDVDHAERVASGTATQETTLVLKLYYDRKSFAVTTDGTLSVSTNKTEAKVGETVEFTVSGDLKQGYHVAATVANATNENETVSIVETKSGFAFAMPSWPVVIKATAAANSDTPYSVEYYGAELGEDGNYQLLTVQKLTGTTDTTVTAEIKTFQGYEEDPDNAARVVSGIVKGDGSSVLKVYYKRMGCTLTFVDLSGVTLKTATVEYGAKGVAEPETDGYVIDDDTIWYWSVNGARYDADNTVWQNTIVEQKLYDKIIRTKEDFYEAFQIKDGVSSAVISGAYILTSDIDFENSGIAIYGFGGLLEGNGYALKNVSLTKAFESHDTGSYGFFQMMSGTIRNMAFIDFKATGMLYNYTANRIDILCRVGIVASKLNGTLENVYVKGMLKGTVNEMIVNNKGTSWPRDGVVFPYGDAEGEAVGGYLAYDATGAKLKNVIVDVLEQRDGLQHNTMANLTQWRRDSKLHLIAGKGVPDVENVFVVETDGKTYNDYGQYAPATRGFMPAEIGVEYGVLSNSQFSDKLIAAFATTFDIARYVEENASVSPLYKGSATTAEYSPYEIRVYGQQANGSYTLIHTENVKGKTYETVTLDESTITFIPTGYAFDSSHADNLLSGKVMADGSLILEVYAKNLNLRYVDYSVKVKYKYLYTTEYVDVSALYSLGGNAVLGGPIDITATATANVPAGFKLNTTKSTTTIDALEENSEFVFAYDQEVAMISFEDTEMHANNPNKVTWSESLHQDSKITSAGYYQASVFGVAGCDYYIHTDCGSGSSALLLHNNANYKKDETYTIQLTKQMIEGLKKGGTLSFKYSVVGNNSVTKAMTVNDVAWSVSASTISGQQVYTYTHPVTYTEENAPEVLTIFNPGHSSRRFALAIDDITVTLPSA